MLVNDRVPVDDRRTVLVTVGSALLLGVLVLLSQTLPGPLADLAGSGAVWAVPAFLLGRWVRGPWWRCRRRP